MKIIPSQQVAASFTTTVLDLSSAKDFDTNDIMDLAGISVQIEIRPTDEDTPMPWDAGFGIAGQNFLLEGSVGSNGFGSCSISIPKSKAAKYYMIELTVENAGIQTYLRDFLESKNVKYK